MEEGLLSLKWNNHKSTFFHVLSILREKHTYTDVTLACDGRLYPAHKFVLSTCSEYFSDIFTSTTGNNIVIVLKDVRRQDLEYLLDYMYLGQVDVAQSELSSLIKTAECLRIKGLAIPDDEPQKIPRRGPEERDHDGSPPSKKKRHLAEEERTSSISSNNTTCRIPHVALPPPLPPQSPQQQALLQRLQVPLPQPPQAPPTSQAAGKSHPSPLPHSLAPSQVPRTSQVPTSPHATTSTPQPHPPLSSPTQSTSLPVIKQEVADPPETPEVFMNESYEETETKPDVSDSRHMEQDVAIAGPSGLQGSSDNWDGDNDLASFAGGEGYSEGGIEEQGDSEVQGEVDVRTVTSIITSQHPRSQALATHNSQTTLDCNTITSFAHNLSTPRCLDGGTSPSSVFSVSPSNTTFAPLVIGRNVAQALTESSEDFSQDFLKSIQQGGAATMEGTSSLVCPYCGKVSRCLSHLQTHVRVHTGERPYACHYCPFRTTQKVALKEHIYTHTGEKPHSCPHCNFKCAKKCNLNSHMRRHHMSDHKLKYVSLGDVQ